MYFQRANKQPCYSFAFNSVAICIYCYVCPGFLFLSITQRLLTCERSFLLVCVNVLKRNVLKVMKKKSAPLVNN